MNTPRKISRRARNLTASLQADAQRAARRKTNPMQVRSKRAARLRAKLLAFREHYHLTWEELAYVMKHSDANVILSVITLKRFGLAYVIPYDVTLDEIERFLAVAQKMRAADKRR